MGGGAILRSVARAAASVHSTRPGLSSVLASGSSSRYGTSSMLQPYGAVAAPSLRLPVDEWELVGGSGGEEIHDRLIFGNMPSRDEVEEATSDLQAALGLCVGELHDSMAPVSETGSATASSRCKPDEVRAAPSMQSPTASVHSTSVLDWIEPHLVMDAPGNFQVSRRNEVMDAFRLLQNDPTVKGVVMSIATDKAVWEAVLSNEKVKELRKKLVAESSSQASAEVPDESEHGGNTFLLQILKCSKRTLQRLQSVLKDVFNSIITFADKKFPAGDSADKALKSCFMLGVMVVSVVLLKRAVVI